MKCNRVHAFMVMGLAIMMSFSSTACSFVFASKPPANHETMTSFDCTDSRTLPALDTLFTVLQVLRVGVAAAASEEDYEGASLSRGADIGLGVAFAGLGVWSAIHGFNVVETCQRAKRDADLRWNKSISWMPTHKQE